MEKPLSLAAKLLLLGAGGLAVVAGPILFLFPTQTEAYFAWMIQHPLTPVFMGANYLGGLGALWTVRTNRWSVARVQMPGIFVFAITQLFATLLHIPIFNWTHPIAWAWLFVYIVSPIAALLVYLVMDREYLPPSMMGRSIPTGSIVILNVFALISALLGIALILWPFFHSGSGSVVPWWAWTLTSLTARVTGGWYLAAAALYYTLSRQRRLDTIGPSLLGVIIVTSAQLLGAWLWRGAFDGSPIFIALYLIHSVAGSVFSAFTLFRNRSAFRMAGSYSG
ncbi:MAG TPA: hypothetical protein VK897_17215 [Anaerolineales bacterium]|nr:hypothetical protein [Anaerolineales bacterium]